MNPEEFQSSPSGHLVPTIQNCFAFVPNPLPPPSLNLTDLLPLLVRATRTVGELSGIGRTLPNPFFLIRPYMRMEAIASSKIEGTVTTLSELFEFEAGADSVQARADTKEVHNYIRALEYGLKRIHELPISTRFISELHGILMSDVSPARGAQFQPGAFKIDQNWIGARLIQNARFVPPPQIESMTALGELEKYINEKTDSLPLIVKLALIHYQFEAIHPFPDGNGRVGRILIPLLLCDRNEMSQPLLYLSPYFEKNYAEYIDRMLDISRRGAWEAWIEFFLIGIEQSCKKAIKKAHTLQDLYAGYRARIQTARSSALLARIVDALFDAPATNIPYTMARLGITYNSAKNNIQRLIDCGILEAETIQRRPKWFYANEIIEVAYKEETP
ncbi:MAG TPA: Fic family protein [Alphaproteobacteria bacterium]|nr:Fic family protein [Alphaproteobacteria bacterium]